MKTAKNAPHSFDTSDILTIARLIRAMGQVIRGIEGAAVVANRDESWFLHLKKCEIPSTVEEGLQEVHYLASHLYQLIDADTVLHKLIVTRELMSVVQIIRHRPPKDWPPEVFEVIDSSSKYYRFAKPAKTSSLLTRAESSYPKWIKTIKDKILYDRLESLSKKGITEIQNKDLRKKMKGLHDLEVSPTTVKRFIRRAPLSLLKPIGPPDSRRRYLIIKNGLKTNKMA